jgi:hypothetical protein
MYFLPISNTGRAKVMGIRKLEPMLIVEDLNNDRESVLSALEALDGTVLPINADMSEEPTHSPPNEDPSSSFANRFEEFLAQQTIELAQTNSHDLDNLTKKALDHYQYQLNFEQILQSKGNNVKKYA